MNTARSLHGSRRQDGRFGPSRLVGLLLACLMVLPALPVRAQQPPIVIAVLGIQEIMRDSAASQGVQAEAQKREAARRAEVEKRENALLAADQQLAQQRSSLSQDDFVKKRNELAQQAVEVRKYAQTQQGMIAEMARKGEAEIRKALVQIVAEIAKEKGITVVLSKASLALYPDEFDITAEALKRLNAKLPSVTLAN